MSARTADKREPLAARSDQRCRQTRRPGALWVLSVAASLCTVASNASGQGITEIMDANGDGMGNVFGTPVGIVADSSGDVFVTSHTGSFNNQPDTNSVFRITPTGAISLIMETSGDGLGNELYVPYSLAVDANDNLFVAGHTSNNVFKVTPNGVITEIIDENGDGMGNMLGTLTEQVAVDPSGNVFVGSQVAPSPYTGNSVFKITPGNTITEIIGLYGDGAGNTLDDPTHVATDASGNVYVSGRNSDNVFKITPNGVITVIMDASGDGMGNPLISPDSLDVDTNGNVFVAALDSVFKITPNGVISQIMDSTGDGCDPYHSSGDLRVDIDGNVLLAAGDRVFKIGANGNKSQIITENGDEMGNTLHHATGLALDASGNIFVAGFHTNNVFKVWRGSYACVPEGGPYFEEAQFPEFPWTPFFPDCTGGQLYSRVDTVDYPVQDDDLEVLGIDPDTIDFSFGTLRVPIWEIHFDGELLAPAQLTFYYQSAPPLVDPEQLAIFHFDEATATWEELPRLEFVPYEWIMVEAESFSPFVLGISRSVLDCAGAIDTDDDGVPDECPAPSVSATSPPGQIALALMMAGLATAAIFIRQKRRRAHTPYARH